ncbi:MAG: diguanylate cyclase [Candidatus Omnitrophica bacterium]|nr:diguanylate cyclase [Candidatus Omnitrophota bacterium]
MEKALFESEKNYESLFNNTQVGLFRATISDGKLIECSRLLATMLGYKSRTECIKDYILDEHYLDQDTKKKYLEKMNKKGGVDNFETEITRNDGTPLWVNLSARILPEKDFIEGAIIDITDHKKSQEILKTLQISLRAEKHKIEKVLSIDQKMSSILDLNHLVDFVIKKSTEILISEKCSLMLLDEDSKELVIKGSIGLDENVIKETRLKYGEGISGRVAVEGSPLLVTNIENDIKYSRKSQPQYKTKSFMIAPIKVHGKLVGVVNVTDKKPMINKRVQFNEIDLKILCSIVRQASIAIENANYYRHLEFLSTSDSITDLFNHRYFIKRLDHEMHRLNRYKRPLSLLMFDIDNFKAYNDSYGHLEGDRLLKEFGTVFKKELRSVDIVCRYAGDEFVAILPETNSREAQVVGEKIIKATKSLKTKSKISLSVGVAECSGNITSRRDLIMRADQALYKAKKEGKNRVCKLTE